MTDFRALLSKLDQINEAIDEDIVLRRVQSNGNLTNTNINRDQPSKIFTNVKGGGISYTTDDFVKVYYVNDDRLQAFLDTSAGRDAIEVDENGDPIEDPDADNDSAEVGGDNDAQQGSGSGGGNDGSDAEEPTPAGITLKDGSSFDPGNERSRTLAAQRAGELLDRYRELLRKMNESAPVSLRGAYLKEYNLYEAFLLEALTREESLELADIIDDLNTLIGAEGLLSTQNQELFRREIADAPDVNQLRATTSNITDFERGEEEEPQVDADAERASDASGDADATVDPGEGETAGSLEAFANSGKGGLANDPDEVDAITELQQYLTDLGFDPNGVDGKYGRGTIAAVKEFQKYFGAKEDGDAGPETIGKIIKLRSIRWGEGGNKDFIQWRQTMTRMEELIGKAGNANESVNMNSMAAILEVYRRLDEALSDAEADELQSILDELRSAYEDGEFTAALPPNVADRFTSNFRAGEGVLADMGRGGDEEEGGAEEEGGDEEEGGNEEGQPQDVATMDDAAKATAIHEGIDGMGTDEEAVLAVLGSIADEAELNRVKQAFQQLYNEDMMDWINSEVSFSEQDAVDNIINRITGDPDAPQTVEDIVGASEAADALDDALNGGFFFGLGTEEQAVLEILGRISVRDFPTVMAEFERKTGTNLLTDLESELSGTDRERVNNIIKRFGYEFQDEDPGYREIGGEEGAEEGGEEDQPQDPAGGEPDENGNVQPRPTESGVQGDYARAAWDDNYGETHNPDGTPKAGAEGETGAGETPTRAKEVWDEIKAMRDEQPQGTPARRDLSNLMNQINVSSTTDEDAEAILAQAKEIQTGDEVLDGGEAGDDAGAEGETGAETDPELPTVTNAPSPVELEQLELEAAEQRILDSFDDESISLAWPVLDDYDKQLLADLLRRAGRPVPGDQ